MRFVIKHEIRGRIRVRLMQARMSYEQADTLQYFLEQQEGVSGVKINCRTQNVVICFSGNRDSLVRKLQHFHYDKVQVPEAVLQNSGRALHEQYWEKLVSCVTFHYGRRLFLPMPLRNILITCKAVKYVWHGIRTLLRGKIEVPVLDATAIGVSMLRGDRKTAASVMFLLGVGEILEEWTHKKSVEDLARNLSLNIGKVWLEKDGQEILVSAKEIQENDIVVVHLGNVIPFDGVVTDGEAMVNQSSLTGESIPVRKNQNKYVYAGTVVEEGDLKIAVKETNGSGKFEKIVTMIEESEKLKSSVESKAEHLADRLVPYTLGTSALTWLLSRNVTKAVSVLMVDFSCAMKLAMPISVLSAIREANQHHLTVKGGKYLEMISEADTIVFDKTGTLTKAQPQVMEVISFNGEKPDELLRIAACLEEHFPHSMAKAVVQAAADRQLVHEELHSDVEYIVAHGISTRIQGKKAIIGSYHFVFEDEQCQIPDGMQERFAHIPEEYSNLYLAIEQKLAAVICIQDPLREEAREVIGQLRKHGVKKVVMMTGDSERTACAIAQYAGVDEYYSEVLPEDKAGFIAREKAKGHKVVMVGDGVNDSPALSAADVGIAVSDGAEIAREVADITIRAESLYELLTLKNLADELMKRIRQNYKFIVGFNAGLIGFGIAGVLTPTVSATLHNTSTLLISLKSMQNLLEDASVERDM